MLIQSRFLGLMSAQILNVILTAIDRYRIKEPVLRIIRFRKTLLALLIGVVLLSMWSSSIAALFCPHMMGGDCCITQKPESGSHHPDSNLASSTTHDNMDDMHMSEMEMDISPSDMKMDDTSTPLRTLDPHLSYIVGSQTGNEVVSATMGKGRGPCSHCEMHSRATITFPVSVSGQASVSRQIIARDADTATLKTAPLVPQFFELHEHGPPGSSASPVYILIGAFRI